MFPYVVAMAALAGAFIGFLAGLTTFKRSLVWCGVCGETLKCPGCRLSGRAARVRTSAR